MAAVLFDITVPVKSGALPDTQRPPPSFALLPDTFYPLGMGKYEKDGHRTFYVIVVWPKGLSFRRNILGFR